MSAVRVSEILKSQVFDQNISRWTWVSQYQNASIVDFIGAKYDGGDGGSWSYK